MTLVKCYFNDTTVILGEKVGRNPLLCIPSIFLREPLCLPLRPNGAWSEKIDGKRGDALRSAHQVLSTVAPGFLPLTSAGIPSQEALLKTLRLQICELELMSVFPEEQIVVERKVVPDVWTEDACKSTINLTADYSDLHSVQC